VRRNYEKSTYFSRMVEPTILWGDVNSSLEIGPVSENICFIDDERAARDEPCASIRKGTSTFRAQAMSSNFVFSCSAFATVLRTSRMFLSFGLVIGGVQRSSQSDALRRAFMNLSPSSASECRDCGAKATISRERSIT